MLFRQFLSREMANFSYLIADKTGGEAAVVDPSFSARAILDAVRKDELNVMYVINTHGHFDHTSGNAEIVRATGAKIAAHRTSNIEYDIALEDGDVLKIGSLKITVIHTPGHSRDSICLLCWNKLITGDTLFVGECGRTDLPESSPEDMYESLLFKIASLDDSLEIWPGHDYGARPSSTLGYEKKHNYTLKPKTKREFLEFMNQT